MEWFIATNIRTIVIALCGLIVIFALRKKSAALQHFLALSVLSGIIATTFIPITTVFQWSVPVLDTLASGQPANINLELPPTTAKPVSANVSEGISKPAAAKTVLSYSLNWRVLLQGIWVAGCLLCLVRWCILWCRTKLIVRRASDITGELCLERLEKSAHIKLLVSNEVSSPCMFGWLDPVVILPYRYKDWSEQQLAAAIEHELSHIERRDYLWWNTAMIASAIHWHNPLVWLLRRKLGRDQERACDDRVIAAGFDATEYAQVLLSMVQGYRNSTSPKSQFVMMARSGKLNQRIRSVLDPQVDRSVVGQQRICITLLVTFLLVLACGSIVLTAQDSTIRKTQLEKKLRIIMIPQLEFNKIPLKDAIAHLEKESAEVDPSVSNRGVKMIIRDASEKQLKAPITLHLANVPLSEALRYTTSLAAMDFEVQSTGVVVAPAKPKAAKPVAQSQKKFPPIVKKLVNIRIPRISFSNVPLDEAIEFLRSSSVDFDPADTDKGVTFIIGAEVSEGSPSPITLNLTDVALHNAVRYITAQAGVGFTIKDNAVIIVPPKSKPVSPAEAQGGIPAVQARLDRIEFPRVEFINTPITEAIEMLREKSVEFDTASPPGKKGVNIVVQGLPEGEKEPRVSGKFFVVSLGRTLKYIAQSTGMEVVIQPDGVVLRPSE
ncbi:MAG: M56 family metallopeptidase [Verrucomicrobiales bacterium]|nr:M56 family metallopeptidase [Verrucomicrobiales bacterium]